MMNRLLETEVAADPIEQFLKWFDEASKASIAKPNAMSVATIGADHRPSARMVLCQQVSASGFIWFTNYRSRKGQDIAHCPYVALLFYWETLARQVRIEGKVEQLSDSENDAYFASRPLESQWSAMASAQSQAIDRYETLQMRYTAIQQQYRTQAVRPEHWGGYRVIPKRMEFWQERSYRLHDRILYTYNMDGTWSLQRLQP